MKQVCNRYFIFSLFLFTLIFSATAQNKNDLWSKASELERHSTKKTARKSIPTNFEVFHLNTNLLKSKLNNVPKRKGESSKSSTVLNFPNENGSLEKYEIFETPIMEESLQKKYPNIKSYSGKSLGNPGSIVRFSVTSLGLHAMIFQNTGSTIYIDPYTSNNESYIVYSKKSLPEVAQFECKFDEINTTSKIATTNLSAKAENANDGKLRTFKLAIATTGEYSKFHLSNQNISASATDAVKKEAVLAAIVVTMTRVNGIFERDVALTMILVGNETNIIFLDPLTDNFTNDNADKLIDESQTVIDAKIGSANYDIGHTFSTGGGGLAQSPSACTSGKARGITGSSSPIGDPYDVDYVAHEMGHQYGAHHTFNGDAGNCAGDNRNLGTAVEPGSGSTIMSYAGICAPQDIQRQGDSYFHLVSIREMWTNISVGSSKCAAISTTGNNAPTVNDILNYTIPISTPFILNAIASDVDADNLTYTWEQLDTEIAAVPLVSTAPVGPAFRSIPPSDSPKRYFPKQRTIISGDLLNEWEVLPSVARTMRFGVNVRDNNSSGGQTASKETVVTFSAISGPFKVTSQGTAVTWAAGTSQTITWNVANTNVSPVNCLKVNILLSTDGGLSFPVVLISNVSNDGSQEIIVPNNSTTSSARIKVESVGNIFYAMNSANITIQDSEFIMNFDSYSKKICTPNSVIYNFTYTTFLGFNETTTFSATGKPAGTTVTFSPTSASANNTAVTMTISGITTTNVGNSSISVIGTSATKTKTTAVSLDVYSSTVNSPILNLPIDNALSVLKPYVLSWGSDVNALSYDVQISTDNLFATIAEAVTANTNSYNPLLLLPNTIYYWRVKSKNDCGESSYSSTFNFSTENEVCDSTNSTNTPINIPDDNTTGVNSIISIPDTSNKTITDVNVTVNITHPWIGDLTLTLISPSGKSVLLAANIGDEGDNFTNTVFDSDGITSINSGIAPFTGVFVPQGNLANFKGEDSFGNWTLNVVDGGPDDIGVLENWSIEICGVPIISNDNDKDGVFNVDDLCPNTPLGSFVDATGCQLFSLPPNNFAITVTSETCPDKNNGQISILATETHNYTAVINGIPTDGITPINIPNANFTTSLPLNNLTPGIYTICISVTGEIFEQCFVIEVLEGIIVSGKSSISSNKASIEIIEGTAPYTIYLNEEELFETTSTTFSVDVKHGDVIEVKTAVACEGIFSKTIVLFDTIVAYPNPNNGIFEIALPISQKEVTIELYTIQSQLIFTKTVQIIDGKVQLNIENQPTGLYFAKIRLDKPIILKILKQ